MQTKGNKNRLYVLFSVLIGFSLVVSACTTPTPAPTVVGEPPSPTEVVSPFNPISAEELTTSTWQWVGGREAGKASPYSLTNPENYNLTFNQDGTLFIQADCNTSRSTYELSGDQLNIQLGPTTLVACEPGSRSSEFLVLLEQAAQVGTAYGNLVIILQDSAGEMYFQRAVTPALEADLEPVTQEELVDTLWQWTRLVETMPFVETEVADPENYNLILRLDGTYSAKADCNQLAGNYELVGSQLTLKPGITTLALCEPDSKYDLYTNLLARVSGVGMRDGDLVLLIDDQSAAMHFANAGEAPLAQPETIEGDPAAFLGQPDGVDNFNNANHWSEFDNPCFTSRITGGQFVMTANGQPQTVCWEVSWPQLENFYIETTLRMPDVCDPQDRFGLLFRAPDTNRGYLYGFTCAGQYILTIWDGEATTVLVEPTRSEAILNQPGAVNRMGLLVFEENISLYANGIFLQTATDYTFLDVGRFGYFVRAATQQPFTVRYDQLGVWVLEEEFIPGNVEQPYPDLDLPAPEANVPTGEARVNVNVRTGPSTMFPIIGTARQGDTGQILGINPNGSWYAVSVPTSRVGTGVAWVSADFVILTNPTGQPLPVVNPPLLPPLVNFPPPAQFAPQVVMREPATLRSGPTLEFPVFGVAPNGSRAEVAGESQDREWWAVRVPTSLSSDGLAWVFKSFTSASNIGGVPVLPTPNLPRNITPAAPASGAPALITRDTVNVRTGPGNEYASLGRVARNSVLAVIGVSPDREHYVINIPTSIDPSGRGWVPARFVRAENVQNVPVVQPPPLP